MKKNLLIVLILLIPFIAGAQDNVPLFKDFYSKAKSIPTSFVFNEHMNIMQVNKDNENFDIIAVNDQMQVIWKTELKGYAIAARKFKNKILAVASTEYSGAKSINDTFNGYLLDPATGKVLIQKIIYDGTAAYMTSPYIFTGEGDYFKLVIRQSGMERRLHVATPLIFLASNSYEKQLNETKSFDVTEFNDQLEVIDNYKPEIQNGDFVNLTCNNAGDLFISWFTDNGLDFVKYNSDKNSKPVKISSEASFKKSNGTVLNGTVVVAPSKKDAGTLYYSLMYKNADKETELGVGKLDFNTGKKKVVTEVFSKDNVKRLDVFF